MALDPARIERVLDTIVAAAAGDHAARVPLVDVEDALLEVEVGINYLLDELDLQHQRSLDHQRALLEQSQALVALLSTPIIVLWPGVLALPLIGQFELERMSNVTETLLGRGAAERASHVILDLTGVEDIASDTIAALLSMVRALGLLGVQCLLTGIHPRSARRLVELEIDLGRLRTLARVSDALALVMTETRVSK